MAIEIVDKTLPREVIIVDTSSPSVMPMLEALDKEIRFHGLRLVIVKDTLANGNVVNVLEVHKKKITRKRKSKNTI